MRNSSLKGFTLIELIISVGLFSVVALITASAYLNLVDLDRRTRATSDLVNNMTFVINSMASSLRTGTNYSVDLCTGPLADGNGTNCTKITFIDSSNCSTTYYLQSSGIWQSQVAAGGLCTSNGRLTDPNIKITKMYFSVKGNGTSGDYFEPQVTLFIGGSMVIGPAKTSTFSLQTSAVQRGIDLPSTP